MEMNVGSHERNSNEESRWNMHSLSVCITDQQPTDRLTERPTDITPYRCVKGMILVLCVIQS